MRTWASVSSIKRSTPTNSNSLNKLQGEAYPLVSNRTPIVLSALLVSLIIEGDMERICMVDTFYSDKSCLVVVSVLWQEALRKRLDVDNLVPELINVLKGQDREITLC